MSQLVATGRKYWVDRCNLCTFPLFYPYEGHIGISLKYPCNGFHKHFTYLFLNCFPVLHVHNKIKQNVNYGFCFLPLSSCHSGFNQINDLGQECEDVDECAEGIDDCVTSEGAVCQNSVGNYTCSCPEGYETTDWIHCTGKLSGQITFLSR